MAIYHLSAQMISRGSGRSVVAAQAYRAAEKIHDERLGRTFDFSHKGGVEHSEIIAPEWAPGWMQDRKKLWNAVEKTEMRKDAQLAREIQVAIPKELSREAGVELVREFAREHFVKHGMVADFSIHWDNPENPHAHITLTTREVTEEGFGKKVREWNSKEWLKGWRESWEHCANRQLAHEGHEQRIDHRSHADRGIQLEPTRKIGASERNLQNDGREIIKERMEEQREIARRNGERILQNPNIALEGVTYQHTTFTQRDVGRWLNTRTVDAQQFNACLAKVMDSDELVQVSVDEDERERFTTKEMLKIEKELRQSTRELMSREGHRVKERFLGQAEATRTLTDEQKHAFRHVSENSPDIAVIEGYAGTGKSYMLGAAREAWEAQGYRVLGAALAGKAAEGLELSSGIQSRSIHAWEYSWKKGYERLGTRDVFVIDEAGMVGQRQMNRVMEHVREAGAKLVLVGDPQQLQAIEAGSPMRMIAEEVGYESLSEIRRQKEAWQKQATVDFHDGRNEKALEAYRQHGHVIEHETQQGAIDSIVEAWDEHRRKHPEQTQVMLAYKRIDVQQMNERARAKLRSAGELKGKDVSRMTERGERDFTAQDRVCFLKNDRFMGVKNGTLGTIEIMEKGQAVIRLDGADHRRVVVDFERYNNIDHGYAATLHKSQGATVDRAHALASSLYDKHTTYVGMTRHVDLVDLHWSREEFGSQKELYQTLSRDKLKQNIVDFQAAIENNERFAELLEKGPANLDADEKKRTRNYAQGDVIRFEKDYKSLGFKKGECAEIARVDYEYNTVYLRTGSGREVEWHPFKHARVELFKEHELPEKRLETFDYQKEARAIEREWAEKKPGSLKELAKSLDRMSNQKDPSLSAIENALEIIEKLEELDRAIERVQGHGNERSLSQGLEKGESMDQEKGLDEQHEGPEDDMEEKQEKDQDMQHELTRSRGGGREFGFGF
jgi:Ti-type conjugative transfer relaxase TraA